MSTLLFANQTAAIIAEELPDTRVRVSESNSQVVVYVEPPRTCFIFDALIIEHRYAVWRAVNNEEPHADAFVAHGSEPGEIAKRIVKLFKPIVEVLR